MLPMHKLRLRTTVLNQCLAGPTPAEQPWTLRASEGTGAAAGPSGALHTCALISPGQMKQAVLRPRSATAQSPGSPSSRLPGTWQWQSTGTPHTGGPYAWSAGVLGLWAGVHCHRNALPLASQAPRPAGRFYLHSRYHFTSGSFFLSEIRSCQTPKPQDPAPTKQPRTTTGTCYPTP